MTGDDALFFDVYAEEFAYLGADISMAGAVEAIAAHAVFLIVFVGEGVHVSLGGHRLVEGGVKHSYLRHVGHKRRDCVDAGHVGGVVERGNVVAFAYLCLYGIVDKHAFAEFLAAVHNAVSYGVDFAIALYAAFLGVGEYVENGFNGVLMVDVAKFHNVLRAVGTFEFKETSGEADFFNTAFGKCFSVLTFEVD